MIVVVIIGILAAIAIPNFMSMQERAKDARILGIAETIKVVAEKDFKASEDGNYPDSILMPDGNIPENLYDHGDVCVVFSEPPSLHEMNNPLRKGRVYYYKPDGKNYRILAYGKLGQELKELVPEKS